MSAETIYLSRRNLLTLLSKLDRKVAGDATYCTIVKYQNPKDLYVQTVDACTVVAVEDADYYTTREPGAVLPADDPDEAN
jgi:hypothetical protein